MMIYHVPKKFYYCVASIVIIFNIAICEEVPATPCPLYFQYFRNNRNGYFGVINVDAPSSNEPLILEVFFSVGSFLQSDKYGSLDIIGTEDELFNRVLQNKMFEYRVNFPSGMPTPTLVNIIRNSKSICSGDPVEGYPVSPIRLSHTFTGRRRSSNQQIFPGNAPANKMTTKCGVVPPQGQHLVAFGSNILRGSWPWLAAIYRRDLKFLCGGNLLSQTVVLTAAHCFDSSTDANSYFIQFGRHDLMNQDEEGYVSEKFKAIHIHEGYNRFQVASDKDIAIALLERPVRYSTYIQPICLWSGDITQESIVGRNGTLVGWGITEKNAFSPTPQLLEQTIINQFDCICSNKILFDIVSNRTFCAGDRDGSGPCKGDSGSSIAMKNQAGQWMVRGIVSGGLKNSMDGCDLTNYVVYSDVAQFLPWIQKFL